MLQMQVSPSVGLRGTRRWNRPGDLRSLSQNAMRMEHLPRSVSLLQLFNQPILPQILPWLAVLSLQVQCHTLTGYCWCVTSDGKPVSGSSVHNRTPVCSGTRRRKPQWPEGGITRILKVISKCFTYTVDSSNKGCVYCLSCTKQSNGLQFKWTIISDGMSEAKVSLSCRSEGTCGRLQVRGQRGG